MRRQIVLLTIAATTSVVIAFIVPLALVVRNLIETRAINDASRSAQTLATVVASVSPDRLESAIAAAGLHPSARVSLFLEDGTVIGTVAPAPDVNSLALARAGRAFTQRIATGISVFVPVAIGDQGFTVVRLFLPSSALREDLYAVWVGLGAIGAGLVAASALIAGRTAQSMTEPLSATSRTAQRLARGDMTVRAPDTGTVEVRAVSHSLNELADRIEALVQEERESLAELSHGLRTPLTALRLEVDQLASGGDTRAVRAAVDRVEVAVTDMITRARTPRRDAGRADVVAVVRDRLTFWSVLARSQSRDITVELADTEVAVRASRADIEAAADALIGNVFEHTPGGVSFAVRVTADDRYAELVVEDAGSGFPLGAAARGARGIGSRGTGLGLDIARRVAEHSGGGLALTRSALGGARVGVRFGRVAGPA